MVSQNTDRQEIALREQGCEKLFIDKCTGTNADRPALKEMLSFAREGDTVFIESISRLARNTRDFLSLIGELTSKGVNVVSMKELIDTSSSQGKFMLTVFSALAELERDMIMERQKEGIAVALSKGVKFGRKKVVHKNFSKVYDKWKTGTITAVQAMRELNMNKSTFYRRVKEHEAVV